MSTRSLILMSQLHGSQPVDKTILRLGSLAAATLLSTFMFRNKSSNPYSKKSTAWLTDNSHPLLPY